MFKHAHMSRIFMVSKWVSQGRAKSSRRPSCCHSKLLYWGILGYTPFSDRPTYHNIYICMYCIAMQCNAVQCNVMQCNVMYACMHVCMSACLHVCMYACMYVFMYIITKFCSYVPLIIAISFPNNFLQGSRPYAVLLHGPLCAHLVAARRPAQRERQRHSAPCLWRILMGKLGRGTPKRMRKMELS